MKAIKIKKLTPNATIPYYSKEGDSGMDLRANFENIKTKSDFKCCGTLGVNELKEITVHPQTRVVVPTGISIQLSKGQEAQVRPRSGQSLIKGFDVALGTIDSGYVGDIGVIVRNFTDQSIKIEHGERIAQLVVAPVLHVILEEVGELNKTERGIEGYGHTGNK